MPDTLVTFNGRFATSNAIAIAAEELKIKTIFHEKNLGKGAALQSGIAIAEGEIIIIEGKHVAVDKNNNRFNKSFDYNTPIWLVGEYA